MFTILVTGNNFIQPEPIARIIEERLAAKYTFALRTLRFDNVPAKEFPLHDHTVVPQGMSVEDPNLEKETCEGIREFYGDPLALLDHVEDVDFLIMYGNALPRQVIDKAKKLKCVIVMRGGPVNVDKKYLEKKGIPLYNTPGRNATGVAELTIGLLLNLKRHLCDLNRSLRSGVWTLKYNTFETVGTELFNKRVGLVGFGKIARHLCRILNGFEAEVVVHDPFQKPEDIVAGGAKPVSMEELLRTSDIVSLHARIPKGDPPLIGAKELAMMKPDAILVNTARGMILDYHALKEALESQTIGGAALDVYGDEPFKLYKEILALPNVFGTSHAGGITREAAERGNSLTVDLVDELLAKYAV
ncbi:MAG: hydroxyacid dehydrogenase [Deltaproteobacteria bacterium]|nr:hydroxyacid dehydrogenase [Deltaproteobacteria bacterium]